ncbi:MAG TPA: FlgD immunoglobulin-like domain containing protein, partial [Candidatus Eisenbacteria bacterium]
PWFLQVKEGGYVNRMGRVTAFSMFVNDSPGSTGGTLYTTNHQPLPQPTIEGGLVPVTLWIPEESPVPVAFARFEAVAEAEGIRLVLELTEESDAVGARLWRGLTPVFEDRLELTHSPIPIEGRRLDYTDRTVENGGDYSYWVEVVGRDGSSAMAGPVTARLAVPARPTLAQPVFPNPVRASASFRYTIGTDGAAGGMVPVSLTLHDVQGRVVRHLASADAQPAGDYEVSWDGRDDAGRRLSSGVYYYLFRGGAVTSTSKVHVVN